MPSSQAIFHATKPIASCARRRDVLDWGMKRWKSRQANNSEDPKSPMQWLAHGSARHNACSGRRSRWKRVLSLPHRAWTGFASVVICVAVGAWRPYKGKTSPASRGDLVVYIAPARFHFTPTLSIQTPLACSNKQKLLFHVTFFKIHNASQED